MDRLTSMNESAVAVMKVLRILHYLRVIHSRIPGNGAGIVLDKVVTLFSSHAG